MKGFSPIPTFCGLDYGRDVVPLSPAVRKANRRNQVVPLACLCGSTGVTDNDWFDFLSQQPGIDGMNFWQARQRKKILQPVIPETILQ